MAQVLKLGAVWNANSLQPEGMSLSQLFQHVMNHGVAVLNGVFPSGQLGQVREAVHNWGLHTEMRPPQTYVDENFHAIESGISPRQKTPHNFHAYNFNHILQVEPPELSQILLAIFEPLRRFQNDLTGNNGRYERDELGRKVRPQIIHYPCGGGMFGRHTHPLEPQRIGLVLALAERGKDFERGSTHFEITGSDIGTDDIHDIGDMILFRFDIPHWITVIDEGGNLDYSSPRGRWTAVLPYYAS
jgi:hypothetical protein